MLADIADMITPIINQKTREGNSLREMLMTSNTFGLEFQISNIVVELFPNNFHAAYELYAC
jgi:hypothetical protein